MPTCFLKRVVPFALTLIVGLMLGSILSPAKVSPNSVVMPQSNSYADGSGAGYGGGSGCRSNLGRVSGIGRTFAPRDVDQKARILSRGEPQYTDEARENATTGTVVLRAVFSASGEVTNIRVVNGLPYGLTESAVEAARGIKFSPAMKDGRAVSQYIQIEYNFNLY
ncbi:MAG TPA: energy transducer TonB [Pyrinomonadaceae bacterium]|nr:energy transducer TonB [Pyrinomonadaceae bacterium]